MKPVESTGTSTLPQERASVLNRFTHGPACALQVDHCYDGTASETTCDLGELRLRSCLGFGRTRPVALSETLERTLNDADLICGLCFFQDPDKRLARRPIFVPRSRHIDTKVAVS